MSVKRIKQLLEVALLQEGEMKYELYKLELEGLLADLQASLAKDKEDAVFAIIENRNHVAMVLVEKSGDIHINELARDRLKEFWKAYYVSNMKKLIPLFAKELNSGVIPINGFTVVSRLRA